MLNKNKKIKKGQLAGFHTRVKRILGLNPNLKEQLTNLKIMTENADKTGNPEWLNPEIVEEVALEATRYLNRAINELQYLIRDCYPDEIVNIYAFDKALPCRDGYNVMGDESGLYIKTPPVPISAYRIYSRKFKVTPVAFDRTRCLLLVPWILSASAHRIEGPKSVYILHVFHSETNYRRCPDYDNYDCKDLIDVALAPYGGDGPNNVRAIVHETAVLTDVDEGTYVAVRAYDPTQTIDAYQDEALEHFRSM